MNKGMQLPINIMVGLAVAVVVMLALVSFFMGIFGPQAEGTAKVQNFNNCCLNYNLLLCPTDKDSGAPTNIKCGSSDIYSLAATAGIGEGSIPRACGCLRTSVGITSAAVFKDKVVGGEIDKKTLDTSSDGGFFGTLVP